MAILVHKVDRKSGFKTPDQRSAIHRVITVIVWHIASMHAFFWLMFVVVIFDTCILSI